MEKIYHQPRMEQRQEESPNIFDLLRDENHSSLILTGLHDIVRGEQAQYFGDTLMNGVKSKVEAFLRSLWESGKIYDYTVTYDSGLDKYYDAFRYRVSVEARTSPLGRPRSIGIEFR